MLTRPDLFKINLNHETVMDYLMDGKFFTVEFIKRGNGKLRVMNCRTRVHKHRRMGQLKFKPSQYNLILVYDVKVKGYRMISVEGIQKLRAQKMELVFI
jgi:hypothetical protein